MSANELKDSGERKVFTTGAQRDRQKGKGMFSLVPNFVIWLVSRVYEDGAAKYASRNWEQGMPLSQYLDSAERHIAKLKCGMRDEPHATQAVWNLIGYIFTATLIKLGNRPAELNDMPDQLGKSGALAEPLSPYEYTSLETFFDRKFAGQNGQELNKTASLKIPEFKTDGCKYHSSSDVTNSPY